MVHGRHREVALLGAGLVAEVRALVAAGVPHALDRVDHVERLVRPVLEADVVEDEELGLGPEVGGVGDAGRLQVLLGLLGDVPRVTRVALAGHRIGHEAVDHERLAGPERVDVGRRRVGHQDHVRLLDLLEPPDRRAVEAVAVLERRLAQHPRRDGDVLHDAGEVAEAEVDELDALRLDHGQDFGRVPISHVILLMDAWGRQHPRCSRGQVRRRPISRPLPVCERRMNWATHPGRSARGLAKTGAHGTPAGLRAALGGGARGPAHPAVVHRRPRPAQELRHQPRRARERPRGGHDLRRLVDRRLLPACRRATCSPAPTPTASSCSRGPIRSAPEARMFCDIFNLDGTPFEGDPRQVLRRNLDRARERGFTLLRRPGDGVLLLRARRRRPAPARSTPARTST